VWLANVHERYEWAMIIINISIEYFMDAEIFFTTAEENYQYLLPRTHTQIHTGKS
jgi:hypothetical protein